MYIPPVIYPVSGGLGKGPGTHTTYIYIYIHIYIYINIYIYILCIYIYIYEALRLEVTNSPYCLYPLIKSFKMAQTRGL